MTIQDLEERISIRANEAVQAKIIQFKKEIDDALKKLFGNTGICGESFGQYGLFEGSTQPHQEIARMKLAAMKMAICDTTVKLDAKVKIPWPSQLWEKERDCIRKDLLEKMDLMQRLLVATSRPSETDVPESVDEPS